jgi:hypothetical protein
MTINRQRVIVIIVVICVIVILLIIVAVQSSSSPSGQTGQANPQRLRLPRRHQVIGLANRSVHDPGNFAVSSIASPL